MSIDINGNKYNIVGELGKGGNGQVFKVKKENDEIMYAIKKIAISNLSEDEVEQIENESKILASINDENIVQYYDSSKDSSSFYILMEYCEGSDLKKFINEHKKQNKLIEEKIIYKIVSNLCLGIKAIHDKNLIHRDLKPENIFISENFSIKIGDFGISKQLSVNEEYAVTSIGTSKYMAPEVIKGEKYNNKVDIWALGCIIYELFTLNVCFDSKSLLGFVDIIIKKKHGTINLQKYNPNWQKLIDLLLSKEYKKRPNITKVINLIDSFFGNIFNKPINLKKLTSTEVKGLSEEGFDRLHLNGKKNIYYIYYITLSI